MSRNCQSCGSSIIDYDHLSGNYACTSCGEIVSDINMTSELAFVENSAGAASVIGQFVSRDGRTTTGGGLNTGITREARDITLSNGKKTIQQLISQLSTQTSAPPSSSIGLTEQAFRLYSQVLSCGYARGRRTTDVLCACIYISSVRSNEPYLLIDLSEISQTNVFELGSVASHLARNLGLQLLPNDPSIFIHRFAAQMQLGTATHTVARDALKILQLMQRDWIATGRRPNGLCAASLLLSSRAHGFHVSIDEIAKIVKMSGSTIKLRLAELSNSGNAQFSITDLHEQYPDQHTFLQANTASNQSFTVDPTSNETGGGENNDNSDENVNLQQVAAASAMNDPPSFQRAVIERKRVKQWRQLLTENPYLSKILIQNTSFYRDLQASKPAGELVEFTEHDILTLSELSLSKVIQQIYFQIKNVDKIVKKNEKQLKLLEKMQALEFDHHRAELISRIRAGGEDAELASGEINGYVLSCLGTDIGGDNDDAVTPLLSYKPDKEKKVKLNDYSESEESDDGDSERPLTFSEYMAQLQAQQDPFTSLNTTTTTPTSTSMTNTSTTQNTSQSPLILTPDDELAQITYQSYLELRRQKIYERQQALREKKETKAAAAQARLVAMQDGNDENSDDLFSADEKDVKTSCSRPEKKTVVMKKKFTPSKKSKQCEESEHEKKLSDSDDDNDDHDLNCPKKSSISTKGGIKRKIMSTKTLRKKPMMTSDDESGLEHGKNGDKRVKDEDKPVQKPRMSYEQYIQKQREIEVHRVRSTLSHLLSLHRLQTPEDTASTTTSSSSPSKSLIISRNQNSDTNTVSVDDIIDDSVINAISDALYPKPRSLLSHLTKEHHIMAKYPPMADIQNDGLIVNKREEIPALEDKSSITATSTTTTTSTTLNALIEVDTNHKLVEATPVEKKLIFPKLPTIFQRTDSEDIAKNDDIDDAMGEFNLLSSQAVKEVKLWIEEQNKGLDANDIDDDEIDALILSEKDQKLREEMWEHVLLRTHGVTRGPKSGLNNLLGNLRTIDNSTLTSQYNIVYNQLDNSYYGAGTGFTGDGITNPVDFLESSDGRKRMRIVKQQAEEENKLINWDSLFGDFGPNGLSPQLGGLAGYGHIDDDMMLAEDTISVYTQHNLLSDTQSTKLRGNPSLHHNTQSMINTDTDNEIMYSRVNSDMLPSDTHSGSEYGGYKGMYNEINSDLEPTDSSRLYSEHREHAHSGFTTGDDSDSHMLIKKRQQQQSEDELSDFLFVGSKTSKNARSMDDEEFHTPKQDVSVPLDDFMAEDELIIGPPRTTQAPKSLTQRLVSHQPTQRPVITQTQNLVMDDEFDPFSDSAPTSFVRRNRGSQVSTRRK